MRLNRWVLFGIFLSLLWIVGAAIYQRNADVEKAESFAKFSDRVCLDSKASAQDSDTSSCEKERERNIRVWMQGSWGNVAFMAIAPVPLGWLAVFILVYVGRGAVVGFRAVVPWSALSLPKKSFVVFCCLTVGAVVLLSGVSAMDLYVDTQVPVGLPPRAMVTKLETDVVIAEGTWVRSGSTADSALAFPLQTSHIMCSRTERRCTEARASVSNNLLTSELVDYELESWSATTIVFKNDALCSTEIFTIDLNTNSVNGVDRPINKDLEACKKYGAKEREWGYRLSDGFNVYWAERQKARPIPLRVFQAFFGN